MYVEEMMIENSSNDWTYLKSTDVNIAEVQWYEAES